MTFEKQAIIIDRYLRGKGVHPIWCNKVQEALITILWDGNGITPVGAFKLTGKGDEFPLKGAFYFTRFEDKTDFKLYLSACHEFICEKANKDGIGWAL